MIAAISPSTASQIPAILAIVNDAAHAYRGHVPDDCLHEPYMSHAELQHEIDSGVRFWGYSENGSLLGVMGIQDVQDVTLIRHAYVSTRSRRHGFGSKLLAHSRWRELHSGTKLLSFSRQLTEGNSMAYDEGLAERLREIMPAHAGIIEKKLFGGLAFMSRDYMFVGILGETLMARVGPEAYAEALRRPQVREMDFTGRPMKGYVFVDPLGFEEDRDLARWVEVCLKFVKTLPAKKPKLK